MEIIYEDCSWERLGSTFKDNRSREARQESVKLSVGVFKKLLTDKRSRELWQVRRKLSVGAPGKFSQGQAEPGTRAGEREIVRGSV